MPHDLVRDFARELTADPEQRLRHTGAALDWYLATASAAARALEPDKHQLRRLPAVAPGRELDQHAALAFGDAEYGNLLVLVDRLADEPWATDRLLPTVRALFPYLRNRGRAQELAQLNRAALRAAGRTGNAFAEAYALSDLACAHFDVGRYQAALDLIEQSEARWRELDNPDQELTTRTNRGVLLHSLDRDEEALAVLESCAELARERGSTHHEATIYCSLGNLFEVTDPHLAISYHRRSLEAGRSVGSTAAETAGLNNIGFAHLRLGAHEDAIRSFDAALALPPGSAPWDFRIEAHRGRIDGLRRLGRLTEALTACQDLLALAASGPEGYGTGLAEHIRGLVLRDLGRPAEAAAAWRNGLASLANADAREVAEMRALLAATESA